MFNVGPDIMYLLAFKIGGKGPVTFLIVLQGYILIGGEGTRLDGG